MKHIFTISLCFLALSLSAQETITYPYNPDGDVDGAIASPDLLDILGVYGNAFTPTEIQIDGVGLLQVIQDLQNQINNNALPDGTLIGDRLRWNGTAWIPVNPAGCGQPVSHRGYDYSTIQIGDQCWFSENCRFLPVVSPSSSSTDAQPYYLVYGYEGADIATAQSQSTYTTLAFYTTGQL